MSKRAQLSDDEGDSDSDSLVDVAFDFLSPNPSVDYQAIKRLLLQLFGRDAELFGLHELTELILSQPYIGSTIKTDGEESDPYALLTVLNMHIHHEHPSMKALAQYCLSKSLEASSSSSGAKSLHTTLQALFSQSENHVGLVICERLINMPVEVIPPLYNMLKDEMRSANAQGQPFKFTHLLFVSRTYHLSQDEESALANTLPASEARKKQGKTKKRRPEERLGSTNEQGAEGDERPVDGIYSFHAEDALISELSLHTLNYTYTTPPPATQQESRGKDAFGLDTRGRIMLLHLEEERMWDVLVERMGKIYGAH
ncbi:hypothetical protein FA15DRAFT_584494 [Coprinopsis marcescibilis]|uniref:Protein BCP1 n=1 Tax=Coprinopsis marcescibilis TaxID=230819 RepID=A0A5C3LIG4_COPMA|nr:hypothetical protein FA15DRAFT_584494 [Coprinopsis marcescibilis]